MVTPILPGAPWLLAHRSMLGTNRPYKVRLNHQDYVLWQNRAGEIFALDNICPHQQAPLSDGWICPERNTIVCSFHALEFSPDGKLYREKTFSKTTITQSLDVVVRDDYIWSYGGHAPVLPIPTGLPKLTDEMQFIGVAGNRTVEASLRDNLLINYDFNHLVGLHRDLFKVKANRITSFTPNGHAPEVTQETKRLDFTIQELLRDPVLLLMPEDYPSQLTYSFPSTTAYRGEMPLGQILQINFIYPETTTQTRAFSLVWAKYKNPLLNLLPKSTLLNIVRQGIEQDLQMVETLYPQQKPKIRLPDEEILDYAKQLYDTWPASANTLGQNRPPQ